MSRKQTLLCLGALFALYLPFLNQALHVDDAFFVAMGDQVLTDWRHPLSFNFNWMGTSLPVYENSVNPPGPGYFLAGILLLFGHQEWALHLFSFIFIAVLFVAAADLGRRFGADPAATGLLAAAAPAVMVMGHTVTPDVALAAFYTAALACFIRGCDTGSVKWLLAAGACAAIAFMFRYTGISIVPLMVLYALLSREAALPVRVKRAGIAMIFPLMALSARIPHLASAVEFNRKSGPLTSEVALSRTLAMILYVGGTTVFPFSLIWTGIRKEAKDRGFTPVYLAVSGALALYMKQGLTHTTGQAALAFLLFSAALIGMHQLVIVPLRKNRVDREQLFLTLWFGAVFVSCVVQRFVAVRRILILVPAFVLLYLRRAAPGRVPWAAIAATGLLGLAVSAADYSQAEVYRSFAGELAAQYRSKSGTTWISGHWGFQHYMEKLGLTTLDVRKDQPKSGDLVIIASQPWPQLVVPKFESGWPMKAGQTWRVAPNVVIVSSPSGPVPIRTISRMARANFYADANFPGVPVYLPYSFSNVPLEKFTIHRWNVDQDVAGARKDGR